MTHFLAAVFVAVGLLFSSSVGLCPEGHSVAIDREPENGFYFVYTPNQPAGYSRVVTFKPDVVFELPPPGTYEGERIVVCYTDDIAAYVQEHHVSDTAVSVPPPPAVSTTSTTTQPATRIIAVPAPVWSGGFGGRLVLPD